jgi:hypothetical protein
MGQGEKENVVVYRSRNIFNGASGTLLQRYDLAGISEKGIDKRIINVYFGVRRICIHFCSRTIES